MDIEVDPQLVPAVEARGALFWKSLYDELKVRFDEASALVEEATKNASSLASEAAELMRGDNEIIEELRR